MKILAIDPASILGWALSNTEYGIWDLKTRKDESMGMKLIRLKSKLNEIHKLEDLDLIVYERAAGRHTNSIIHQAKLIGIIEKWCEENSIEYKAYSATEIKKFATGKGNAGKPAMVKAAQDKLGYDGEDDNIADALWILNLCKSDLNLK
jgi:Holliday junction resolvasome RuvABC endonuclease subunit